MIKTFLKLLFYKLRQISDSCGRPNTFFPIYKFKRFFFFFFFFFFFLYSDYFPLTLEILIYLEDMNCHDLVNVFESMDHLQVIALCCY
jgi:hypothetical protein